MADQALPEDHPHKYLRTAWVELLLDAREHIASNAPCEACGTHNAWVMHWRDYEMDLCRRCAWSMFSATWAVGEGLKLRKMIEGLR